MTTQPFDAFEELYRLTCKDCGLSIQSNSKRDQRCPCGDMLTYTPERKQQDDGQETQSE